MKYLFALSIFFQLLNSNVLIAQSELGINGGFHNTYFNYKSDNENQIKGNSHGNAFSFSVIYKKRKDIKLGKKFFYNPGFEFSYVNKWFSLSQNSYSNTTLMTEKKVNVNLNSFYISFLPEISVGKGIRFFASAGPVLGFIFYPYEKGYYGFVFPNQYYNLEGASKDFKLMDWRVAFDTGFEFIFHDLSLMVDFYSSAGVKNIYYRADFFNTNEIGLRGGILYKFNKKI